MSNDCKNQERCKTISVDETDNVPTITEKSLAVVSFRIFLVVTIYWFVSITLVFLNKYLLSSADLKLDAPLFVTWYQCVITVFMCAALSLTGKMFPSHIKFPELNIEVTVCRRILPLSLTFMAMTTLNNLCLKYVGVAFYFVVRSLTTVFIVVCSYFMLKQTTSPKTLACCAVITSGFLLGVHQEEVSDSGDGSPPASKKAKQSNRVRAKSGAAKYKSEFDKSWTEQWPFIVKGSSKHHYVCNICRKEMRCDHQSRVDVERHIKSSSHIEKEKAMKSSTPITSFMQTDRNMSVVEFKLFPMTRRAELKVANFIAHHNLPIAVADHLGPLFRDIFSDSAIAQKYSSARTKTTSMINGALKPFFLQETIQKLKMLPFTIHTDGSNDTGLKKLNPITVRIFDLNRHKVMHQFLDMGVTTGVKSATAEAIFNSMDEVMKKNTIPWTNCVGLALDNASVNMGKRNSVMSRALKANPEMYVGGCPCHILHNTCNSASKAFTKETKFDLDEFAVDIFHWFEKSTKRKAGLEEYCQFCDQEYRSILEHVSTRWLSLETCNRRILELYPSLRSYFMSEVAQRQARMERLKSAFQSPMTEAYLLFYSHAFPVFTDLNTILQREEPAIFFMHSESCRFLKKLLSKFVKVTELQKIGNDFDSFVSGDRNLQLSDDELAIGSTTRSLIRKLWHEGDISDHQKTLFFAGVRAFYTEAFLYARTRLPVNDEVVKNAPWVDFNSRLGAKLKQVEYFVSRFQSILKIESKEEDALQEEFIDYQTLQSDEIPRHIWEEATVREGQDGEDILTMDVLWGFLSTMKVQSSGRQRFGLLSKVALLILTLPHSNAAAERVFSIVRQNKTDFRDLAVDGTLTSLLTIKMAIPERMAPCYQFNPSKELVTAAKKCTKTYNDTHCKKL